MPKSDKPVQKSMPEWASARIAVNRLRETIAKDLIDGVPVAQIYRQNLAQLSGVTVGAFRKQVRQILQPKTTRSIQPRSPAVIPANPLGDPQSERADIDDGKRFHHKSNPQAAPLWKRVGPAEDPE